MFKSTYGRIENAQKPYGYIYVPKAVDAENNIEVFKIGSPNGLEVPFTGDIYCLKISSTHIPFVIDEEANISHRNLRDFSHKEWHVERRGAIPIISLKISHIGTNLKSFVCGRGFLDYQDVWPGSAVHGHVFLSDVERNTVFSYIQEALPLLYFDRYSVLNSNPTICISIKPANHKGFIGLDESGALEARSLNSLLSPDKHGSLDEILNTLEEAAQHAPLKMEEFMAIFFDVERRSLFFTAFHGAGLIQNERFLALIKQSYSSHYQDRFASFEKFLIFLVSIFHDRMYGRMVYEKFSTIKLP